MYGSLETLPASHQRNRLKSSGVKAKGNQLRFGTSSIKTSKLRKSLIINVSAIPEEKEEPQQSTAILPGMKQKMLTSKIPTTEAHTDTQPSQSQPAECGRRWSEVCVTRPFWKMTNTSMAGDHPKRWRLELRTTLSERGDRLSVSLYSGGRWRRPTHLVWRPPHWWVGWRLIMQVLGSDLRGCIMGLAEASLVGRLEVDQSTLQVLRSAFEKLYHRLSKGSLGDMLGECIEEMSSGRPLSLASKPHASFGHGRGCLGLAPNPRLVYLGVEMARSLGALWSSWRGALGSLQELPEPSDGGKKLVSKGKRSCCNISQKKQGKSARHPEFSSSSSDVRKEKDNTALSTVQVPDANEVKLRTKVRSRRKTELQKPRNLNDLKFSNKFLDGNRSNLPVPSVHDASLNLKDKLSNSLSNNHLRRWCAFEWFYSAIDYPWFAKREFVEYLNHVGLGHVPRLTRVEWGVIKSSLGKPRRFSKQFLKEEKEKLNHYRDSVRTHYTELRAGTREGLPTDLAKPLSVGQRVMAIHPRTKQIHDGNVLTVDHSRCRVQFDRTELGVEFVQVECF
ncbi:DNA binding protein [Actinidia rufa]|uniref:DNA binding protein n=1 Tax=Actinidia rufa TaxID=165716 RepID=A0A7J0GTB2_9ERIC|nr:DNA binding protein [Actinidia rufa]